jgi:hypothetical protein
MVQGTQLSGRNTDGLPPLRLSSTDSSDSCKVRMLLYAYAYKQYRSLTLRRLDNSVCMDLFLHL